jgi:hypothetical protein
VVCSECGAKISKRAAFCPSCGGPGPVRIESATSERVKDWILALFIIAVVVASGWIIVEITIGRAEAVRLYDKVRDTPRDLNDETVTVPTDEFRGVLVKVPYAGKVTLEIASLGGHSVDVHLIDGADLLRLANAKPPFSGRKLTHHPAFEATAAPATTRSGHLATGTYVVVLEHSTRGTAASEVRVVARLAP